MKEECAMVLPQDFFDLWAASGEHRRNMLRPGPGEIGVGLARTPDGGEDYWVAMFGVVP